MQELSHQELKRTAAVHLYFFIFIFLYFSIIPAAAAAQRKQSFDEGWRFHRGAAIKTSGAHHLAIAGTGHPYDLHSFRSLSPTTFRGQALLIIQPQEERGTVTITATSPKLPSPSTFNVVME